MDKKPTETIEALAKQLQEKLRHERPRWLRWVPLLAVVLFGSLGIIAWLLMPTPEPPRLMVTALDALAVAGTPVQVRAYLDPEDADAKVGSLAGLEAVFGPDHADGALDLGLRRKAISDDQGLMAAQLDPGPKTKVKYQIRQTSPSKRQPPPDRAQIFTLAKDTPLLLIDVEETLADLDVKLWSKTNVLSIAVRPGANDALRAAHTNHNFAIVYLAIANTPAKEYRRVRGWIALNAADAKGLPDGPVLGRLRYDATSDREARQALLSDLRQRFTGPLIAVVRTSDAAEQCLALGIRALAMGGGDFPDQVVRIKGWDELPRALAP